MSTFILIHGAWQTASTWDLVKPRLESKGQKVVAPTLAGLGRDTRALTPVIDLETHIEDIARVLGAEDMENVILVGHSYAGLIITGVADRAANIGRLVYVDAFIPGDGQSALDLLPDTIGQMFRQQAATDGDGWRLRSGDALMDLWGLKAGPARDFVRAQLCDFSIRCFEQKLRTNGSASSLPRTFIAAVGENYPARSLFQPFVDKAKREAWEYFELPASHQCHVELPEEFSEILLRHSSPVPLKQTGGQAS